MPLLPPTELATRLAAYALDYALLTEEVFGWTPRSWQRRVLLRTEINQCLATHRQAGKSEVVSALAAAVTLSPLIPASTSLVVSHGYTHATDILRRISQNLRKAAEAGLCEISEQSKGHIVLGDGSRCFSVASTEHASRGWSISGVLLIDESAFVTDDVLSALFPTVAAAGGKVLLLSTPNGKAGLFAQIFHDVEDDRWLRTVVRASDPGCCLGQDFLDSQRRILGPTRYAQEYEVSFIDSEAAAFDFDSLMRVFGGQQPPGTISVRSDADDPVIHTDAPFAHVRR
jgi:hypothetical protein